jgi:hypothetical protein
MYLVKTKAKYVGINSEGRLIQTPVVLTLADCCQMKEQQL